MHYKTSNTDRSGSFELKTHDLRKLLGKNWRTGPNSGERIPRVKFSDPGSPTVINLYLDTKAVLIKISNPQNTSDWFQQKNPGLVKSEPVANGAAANAIDEISRGAYSPLPPAQGIAGTRQSGTTLALENNTAYGLTIYLSGPSDEAITLEPGQSQSVSLVGGQYRIGAKVASPGVLPFYGVQSFSAGEYSETFYISAK